MALYSLSHPPHTMTVPCATCGKDFESECRYDNFAQEDVAIDSVCVPCFQAEYNTHLDSLEALAAEQAKEGRAA